MDILIKITQFIASLSLLVIIHEFGHFLFAKMFGVRVEKFYLFFNPWFSLFKFRIGETEYGIGWVPFGGYVKLSGMIDESMDKEQMEQPPQPYEFRTKPAWQRLLIMTGGVIMNVTLAVVVYVGLSYQYGDRYYANSDMVYGYYFNDLAKEIGFRDGDKIINVNGKQVESFVHIYPEIVINKSSEVVVDRDGELVRISIPESYTPQLLESRDFMEPRHPFVIANIIPESGAHRAGLMPNDSLVAVDNREMVYYDQYATYLSENSGEVVELTVARTSGGTTVLETVPVEVSEDGKLGVQSYSITRYVPVKTVDYTMAAAIPAGFKRTGAEISSYWKQLKMIFSPKTEAYKSLGGFIAIGSIFPDYWSWEVFWRITAFLSLVLAVMNILPIPALDGGHVLFLLYEVVTRRKPSEKFLERAQVAGMFFLFALIIFANANDIYRIFIK